MTIGIIIRQTFIGAAIITSFMMPSSENVNANTSIADAMSYQAYPLPASKPAICMKAKEVGDETNITQKQAAAAALGLYFGLKQATVPQTGNGHTKQNLCS